MLAFFVGRTGRPEIAMGLTAETFAAELHCSPSVVRQRVNRGLRALRSRLERQR